MKLGKKKDKKILEPCIVEEMTFHLKPMSISLAAKLESYFGNVRAEMFTPNELEHFAKTHITGWENVFDDEGKEVEFTQKNAVLAITDEDNESLAATLYLHSYNMKTGLIDAINEDAEQAKKS